MAPPIELLLVTLAGRDGLRPEIADALLASAETLGPEVRTAVAIALASRRVSEQASNETLLAEELLQMFGSVAQPPLAGRLTLVPRLAAIVARLPEDRRQPLVGPPIRTPVNGEPTKPIAIAEPARDRS